MVDASLRFGTRYELTLESHEGALRAVYRAEVSRPGESHVATVVIAPDRAEIVAGGEAMEPALAHQLVAIAKTIGRRADTAPWPRRINRWRQPGVR